MVVFKCRADWPATLNNLAQHFGDFLGSESLCDVVLSAEGQTLPCHRIILAASSTFFQNIFLQMSDKSLVVMVKNAQFVHLKSLVNFMYFGETSVSSEDVREFLATADVLGIKGLVGVQLVNLPSSNATSEELGAVGNISATRDELSIDELSGVEYVQGPYENFYSERNINGTNEELGAAENINATSEEGCAVGLNGLPFVQGPYEDSNIETNMNFRSEQQTDANSAHTELIPLQPACNNLSNIIEIMHWETVGEVTNGDSRDCSEESSSYIGKGTSKEVIEEMFKKTEIYLPQCYINFLTKYGMLVGKSFTFYGPGNPEQKELGTSTMEEFLNIQEEFRETHKDHELFNRSLEHCWLIADLQLDETGKKLEYFFDTSDWSKLSCYTRREIPVYAYLKDTFLGKIGGSFATFFTRIVKTNRFPPDWKSLEIE